MNKLSFRKMHGLGNDFIVINAIGKDIRLTPELIRRLSDRHLGIGFDQCLVIERASNPSVDFNYRIFNASGEEVGQCGNGARCLARYIHDEQLCSKEVVTVATTTSLMHLKVQSPTLITVDMGEPNLSPEAIPLKVQSIADYYPFEVDGNIHYLHALSVGNPHGILITEKVTDELVKNLGPKLSTHPLFLNGANISFVEKINDETIKLRVFERGVGETNACGSAAVAAAVALQLYHNGAELITTILPGGELSIYWQGLGHSIHCNGPAMSVFDGEINI